MFNVHPGAGEIVFRFVNNLNALVWGGPIYKAPRAGEKRAKARLAAKRKANKKIPDGSKMTRQRIRAQTKPWRAKRAVQAV